MVAQMRVPSLVLIGLSPWMAVSLQFIRTAAERPDEPIATASAGASLRLAPEGEPGDLLIMTGRIVDSSARPVPGATLYVYHADASGAYTKPGASIPRLSGTLRVGASGLYRIETVVPSQIRNLEGGPPHIHGTVSAPGRSESAFAVNLTLGAGRHNDARRRASAGDRQSGDRWIYQDPRGTWWLVYNPTPGIRM